MSYLKKTSILLMVLCVMFALHCSKKETLKEKRAKAAKVLHRPEIDTVAFEPAQPRSNDHIRVRVTLKKKLSPVAYTYQWFINGEAMEDDEDVPGKSTRLLTADKTVKGDKVYCRVTAKRGSYQSEPVKSKEVEIGNSPPQLELEPVESFSIPGTFSYRINAVDPDDDALTYTLVSPLDRGIEIDAHSGEITWEVLEPPRRKTAEEETVRMEDEGAPVQRKKQTQKKEDSFSPRVTIVFEVRDSDGAVAGGQIIIDIASGGQQVPR